MNQDRKLKILAINWQDWQAPQKGGAEFYLKEILVRLVEWGHDITLLGHGYPGAPHKEVLDGIKVIRTGSRNTFNYHLYGMPIRNFIRNNDFDVILDDLNKIPFYTPLWSGSTPVVGIVMHVFRKDIFKETNILAGSYVYWTERLIPRIYGKGLFGCVGDSGREELIEMGMKRERIEVLQVGVLPVFQPGFRKRERLIVSVGRLMRYKCIDHVLYGMKELKERGVDCSCEITGTGEEEDNLKRLINKLGIENRVKMLGWVPLHEIVKLYQRAAVAVQPSVKEGWGLLATDAGACATPVVAARVPGLSDSVIDGKTGFLYEHGNISQMADYLQKLLTDEKLRRKMGQANLEWARTLTWDKVAGRVERMLLTAVEQERSS
ncbi:glycosyltransferase family 4 protein [candidate division WOR-3 bacterium]|nr:glycosyltransferase family 4 protein [candidate division WOR-3 bacterium]